MSDILRNIMPYRVCGTEFSVQVLDAGRVQGLPVLSGSRINWATWVKGLKVEGFCSVFQFSKPFLGKQSGGHRGGGTQMSIATFYNGQCPQTGTRRIVVKLME